MPFDGAVQIDHPRDLHLALCVGSTLDPSPPLGRWPFPQDFEPEWERPPREASPDGGGDSLPAAQWTAWWDGLVEGRRSFSPSASGSPWAWQQHLHRNSGEPAFDNMDASPALQRTARASAAAASEWYQSLTGGPELTDAEAPLWRQLRLALGDRDVRTDLRVELETATRAPGLVVVTDTDVIVWGGMLRTEAGVAVVADAITRSQR